MDYEKVVKAALEGKESAFTQLYESTQRDMYYIALKYMKDEDAAMDVLQDAYLKAWQSLATLKEPGSFKAWFGRIVANTAKNALAKKKPLLFSQLEGENEEGDLYEFDIEDDKTEYQPERSYTQKETQELVRELIDSLSDEQRLCILMYHLDDQSIKDIAQTFGISENTVKSRLLYGRKAIKAKAEELQKKGYQLYTVAPAVLFLYLLHSEKFSTPVMAATSAAMEAQRAAVMGKAKAASQAGGASAKNSGGAATGEKNPAEGMSAKKTQGTKVGKQAAKTVTSAGKKAGKAAAKQAFIHTAAGKVLIGVTAVAVLGGGAAGVVHYLSQQQEQEVAVASENMKAFSAGAQETAPTVIPTASANEEIILTPEPEADDEIILTPEPEGDDEIILTPEPEADDEIVLTPEPESGDEIVITPGLNEGDEITITPGSDDEIVILPGENEDAIVTPEPEEPGIILEQPVADEDFSSLLAGNLTKEELQLVLTYGPSEITESGYPHSESLNTLNSIWQGDMFGNLIEKADYDTYNKKYLLSDVNRLFSLFTDFQFTEDNDYDTETGPNVDGEYIIFIPATLNYSVETQIQSAVYTPEEMRIRYTYTKQIYEEGQQAQTSEKEAILLPNVQGLYQIVWIEDIYATTEEAPVEETPENESPEKPGIIIEDVNGVPVGGEGVPQATEKDLMALYTDAVNASAAGTDGYIFYGYENLTGEREYALYDMNQDGINELILRESINEGPIYSFAHRVYTAADNGAGYELVMVEGSEKANSFTRPTEGAGVYALEFFQGNGEEAFYRVTLENGSLVRASEPERVTTMGDENSQAYWNQEPDLTWYAVSDLSGLGV
jgi:RNA polymerase sigma factor (sigma-70 family)